MENTTQNRKLLVAVAFEEETGNYIVDIPKGMSANEVAFAVHVIARCFERDNIMSSKDFIALAQKYLGDEQFNEIKG
jgi:hypothetical protein